MKSSSCWQLSEFGHPKRPGVYAVISVNVETNKTEVVYVGSSCNIRLRLQSYSHPYRILYNASEWPIVIAVKYKLCDNYLELERFLIKKLQPKHNSNFKSKIL